ncbi:MAG: UDP-2,3-diacylglucosamine diphosphatase [Gammaproteobacteria bacterium]
MSRLEFRSVWISDVHLGTRDAQVEYLLDFLRHVKCDYLYLVGDIIDIWKVKSGWYWPALNNELIREVVEKARQGTRVIYVPGNHDEMLRDYVGGQFYGIELHHQIEHRTADGRTFLVLHGDEFDCVVRHSKWLAYVGGEAYDRLLILNRWFNRLRRRLGFSYWSLSAYIKYRVKNAVQYIGNFESAVAREARRRGADGVICGHIHHARIAEFDGIYYGNSGDWVESCTALAEDASGELRLIRWTEESALLTTESDALAAGDTVLAPVSITINREPAAASRQLART